MSFLSFLFPDLELAVSLQAIMSNKIVETLGSKIFYFLDHRPVSSVGRASDYCAGGRWPQTGPTLRVLK